MDEKVTKNKAVLHCFTPLLEREQSFLSF